MKYFDFLFYLLSYTTGIGASTLLILQYLKYNKTLILRDLIFFDLCFTLHFIVEMLSAIDYSSVWIDSLILSGLFFTNIGMAYFVGAYFYRISNREIDQKFKTILWSGAALTGGILILLPTLSQKHLVPDALHTGYTIINFFLFLTIGYTIYLTNKKLNKSDRERKQVSAIIVIVALTLAPAAVIQDQLLYRVQLKHPVLFTPLSYFIINLAIIFYDIRNAIPAEITNLHTFDKENLLLSQVTIIKEHNITERELEVMQLILNGYSNHEISKKLFISSNTVRNHIYSIFKKLDVKNRLELSKNFINQAE